MALVDKHPAGAPCWFELGTTDQAAAKKFYSDLFGWTVFDAPIGGDQFYSTFRIGERDVCAAYTLMPEMMAQGVPPHWMVYFATGDIDQSVANVAELRGKVIQPPMDVFDFGHLAVCQDPTGANFSMWQPKTHHGAGVINQEGSVCWSELATRDVPAAREFYTKVFAWTTHHSAGTPAYIEFSAGGEPRGGLLPMDEHWEGIPPHWGIYFLVSDCDASVAQAKELGGVLRHGPFDAPGVGRIAMMADPQGAGFSLITLQTAA